MKNTNPLVSVIIPVYNGEKYIDTCLQCMMRQTYSHLEIIVVDDGSKDNSATIAKKYNVRIVSHDSNRGLAATRNTGIISATGRYIHFMDVDDRINSRFYEKMVGSIVATEADMACCGIIHQKARSKTQLFTQQKLYTTLNDRLLASYVGKWGYAVRYLFSRDFLVSNNLFFEEGRVVEDLPFSFAAVCTARSMVVVPEAEYLYVFNSSSIMNTNDSEIRRKRRDGRVYALKQVTDFARSNGDFKIPGVNTGKVRYILRKLFANFRYWRQSDLSENL